MSSTTDPHPIRDSRRLVRLGPAALTASGVLFLLYPAVRPWHDESTVGGAVASMSSNAWVAAHLFAMVALILMPLGLLAICRVTEGSRGFGLSLAGTVAIWLGAGLALPYYGAEDSRCTPSLASWIPAHRSTCLSWSMPSGSAPRQLPPLHSDSFCSV